MVYNYFDLKLSSFLATASPPVNFTVTSSTSNAISFEWGQPIKKDINGIIRHYVIRYHITEQLGVPPENLPMDCETTTVVNTTLTTALYDLDNYTVYGISVAAVTVGEGPNAILSHRTAENGKK